LPDGLKPGCSATRARFARTTDPIFVIPLFFSSKAPTRLVICLFLHPVLLEAGEAVGRGTRGDAVASSLRSGEIKSFEEAAELIVENSLSDSGFKLIMAFYRRFMLLSMGSAQATMFAVVAASIEEASVCLFGAFESALCCRLTRPRSPPLSGPTPHRRPDLAASWSRSTRSFDDFGASCR